MNRGYTRGEVLGVGAGAAEWWAALLASDPTDRDRDRPVVGTVREVFERSAYLELAIDAPEAPPTAGPPLVLLCGESIEGPLTTRIRLPGQRRFRGADLERDDPCRIHRSMDGSTVVIRVGSSLDLTLDPTTIETGTPLGPPISDLTTLTTDDERWRRGVATLDYLEAGNHTDGLQGIAMLRDALDGRELPPPWASLVETWSAILHAGQDARVDGEWVHLLGRGPGATPSGDDVLAGVLLLLLHGTAGEDRRRILTAAGSVVDEAVDRTTAISAALLAQAARGRADPTIERCLHGLLASDWADRTLAEAIDEVQSIGHTSGIDTLVGMLLALLVVAPHTEETR